MRIFKVIILGIFAVASVAPAYADDLTLRCAHSPYRIGDPLNKFGPPPDDPAVAKLYNTLHVTAIYTLLGQNTLKCGEGSICRAPGEPPALLQLAGYLYRAEAKPIPAHETLFEQHWFWYGRDYEMDTALPETDSILSNALLRIATKCPESLPKDPT